jgi:hypothetical protein
VLKDYVQTRAFRDAVLVIWAPGVLGQVYLGLRWSVLWHPWVLVITYLTWIVLLGPATAVQIADRLKHKTGNFPKKPPPGDEPSGEPAVEMG